MIATPGGTGDVDLESVEARGGHIQGRDHTSGHFDRMGQFADRGGPSRQFKPDGNGRGDTGHAGHGVILALSSRRVVPAPPNPHPDFIPGVHRKTAGPRKTMTGLSAPKQPTNPSRHAERPRRLPMTSLT